MTAPTPPLMMLLVLLATVVTREATECGVVDKGTAKNYKFSLRFSVNLREGRFPAYLVEQGPSVGAPSDG